MFLKNLFFLTGRLISLIGSPDWNDIDLLHKFVLVGTSLPLDFLNVLWFYKIIKIALRYRKDENKLN